MMKRFYGCLLLVGMLSSVFTEVHAMDFTEGLMTAVPVKNGQAPKIDGDLGDWDLSAAEPVTLSEQSASQLNSDWALSYDDDALYIGVRVSLPNRPYSNPNNATDAFWQGDLIQLRLAADPSLPYPLDRQRDAGSDRVAHVSLWKNSQTGADYLDINRGVGLNLGETANPPGSQVVVRVQGSSGYTVEARLPWSALKAPDGKNPFKVGQKMPFVAETLWTGGDYSRVVAVFRTNPGTFAFASPHTWGQVEFAAKGFEARRHPTLETVIAKFKGQAPAVVAGVPFTIEVPADGLKVSANILGPNGEVLRELMGGEEHPKGPLTVRWDGKDAWGHTLAPGDYKWGAFFHRGLKIELAGSVGTSGDPTYPTLDGKGAWGGDHSDPIDCAADESGLYFLWPVAEAGRPIVKTDYAGRVLWRKSPFVGGGFGPFFAIASDGRYVYLTLGDQNIRLVRLDAATGELLTWGRGGPTELPVHEVKAAMVPQSATPLETRGAFFQSSAQAEVGAALVPQADAVGLATHGGQLFVSSYAGNKILILDAASGKVQREIVCPGPRGLACDGSGNLVAVSYVAGQTAQVVRFAGAAGSALPVVTRDLEAPFDVAVDAGGRFYVSDLGRSQQVKVFDADGAPVRAFGKAGGRPWQGKYDPDAFLKPAGVAIDARGGLLVVESSPPKVISRLKVSDGQVENRWFGPGVYWNSTWPMPEDPQDVFYVLPGGLGRARVAPEGKTGVPNAYWVPEKAGYPQLASLEDGIAQPETVRAANGELYVVHDSTDHAILRMKDDVLRPVATWRGVSTDKTRFPENTLGRPYLGVWIDANGDGRIQPGEESQLTKLADGQPIPMLADGTSSMHMEPNGDLYFMTQANSILKVPSAGFGDDGMLRWDTVRASLAVPVVLPGQQSMFTTYRTGLLGVRLAGNGELYTVFNTLVEGKGGAFDYASPALAARLKDGMGHTATFNVVKFAKYDPQGRLLWMAGRKATAGAKPGEIYHTWNMAGLINDRYVASGSEWGMISFYTHDGFFVDSLMNNPGQAPSPGPYTFGGETSGARVQYFPKQDEVWAYSSGMAYRVLGFKNGLIEGEGRASGTVTLDKAYDTPGEVAPVPAAPLQMVRMTGQPLADAVVWDKVPQSRLLWDGAVLATAQLGYDDQFLYARLHVNDTTPLQNGADVPELAFKGGDTAGIVLGAKAQQKPGAGDIRLMAAQIGGKPHLIAMKAVTSGPKKPFVYTTGSTAQFEFVGDVPDGRVQLVPDPDGKGYTATFAVPRGFLELDLAAGATLQGDLEVRLSGAGARGLQAMERHYLFTASRPETTMVDDVPTEARLYPQYWGKVEIR